ncbi:hypothetical protein C8T65DRAFT_671115 [Cerioporus squamosus]|nr:hypothetical protein C8T65DRAFT_671115 [Cerioporus squamosus]
MTTELALHRIHSPEDKNLPNVLALSNTIFSADGSTKHGSLPYWQHHLSHPSSFVVYLAPASSLDKPIAFLFLIPRTNSPPLKNGANDSLHIWLAGVLPECRKGGCLTRLVQELDAANVLTVCTYPTRFPNMWRWLVGRGWVQEREFDDGKIMLSRSRVA